MKNNIDFYVLTLSHNKVKLYKGDQYGLMPVTLKSLPTDMKSALNIDEYPNWRETHTIAPTRTGKGSEAYHGQYNVRQTDKIMLEQYFRSINKHLHTFLHLKREPLLLAGVNYLLPIYRHVNTYPFLLPQSLLGNVDRMNLNDLHLKAWPLIKQH